MTNLPRKIDVYPFGGRDVAVHPIGQQLETNPELTDFIESEWAEKREGWDNAWIPLVTSLDFFPDDVHINAGVTTYKQTSGILDAIKTGKPFAPESGIMNNLSVGVMAVTNDGHVILNRRAPRLHAGGVWNTNGGYMSSRLIDRANCSDPSFVGDHNLYDIDTQTSLRIHGQEFFGLKGKDMTLEAPTNMSIGHYHSLEPELDLVARIDRTKDEMQAHIRDEFDEHGRVDFVHSDDLAKLLYNQGELLGVDPTVYETDDPTRLILLDDNIGELIGGAYEKITGSPLDQGVVDELRNRGLEINVYSSSDDGTYEFPLSF